MTVRLALTADDTEAAAHLLDQFNREFHVPTPGPEAIAARLATLLAGDDTFALLAPTPGAEWPVVGLALVTLRTNVWYDGRVGLLDELYVVPECRRQSIGSALLRTAEHDVVRRGGSVLEINVDGEDVDARRFYERHGYLDRDAWSTQPAMMYHRELQEIANSDPPTQT